MMTLDSFETTLKEKIGVLLSNIFDKSRVEKILEPEEFQSLDVDWSIFVKESVVDGAFSLSCQQRRTIKILRRSFSLFARKRRDCIEVQNFFYDLEDLAEQVVALPLERLKGYSQDFFSNLFPSCAISFRPKMNGVQLGTLAILKFPDGGEVRYFVKTHSLGSHLSSLQSAGEEPVQPTELLCYRILELLDLGPEAFFFGQNEKNFYIATRDSGYNGAFIEYGLLTRSNDQARLIMGAEFVAMMDSITTVYTAEDFEREAKSSELTKTFFENMLLLDVLEWILRLSDVTSNVTNFGFFAAAEDATGPFKLRIIDFRAEARPDNRRRTVSDTVFGSCADLRRFGDPYRTYSLTRRPPVVKLSDGIRLICPDGPLFHFLDVVARAAVEVKECLGSLPQDESSFTQQSRDRNLEIVDLAAAAYTADFTSMSEFLHSS